MSSILGRLDLTREKVTVCIPHVLRDELLRMCLKSVMDNVSLPYRVIIIADGKRRLFFTDDRIEVIYTGLERSGLAAKRKQFAELVETKYLFALDDDILVQPGSLEAQVQALERNPELAAVSGLAFEKGKFPYFPGVSDFKIIGNFLVRKQYSLFHVFASEGDLFEADYIPIGYTTFRMEALEDVFFDPEYDIGYEHLDIFLQLYFTKWRCAVHKKSLFEDVKHKSPGEYLKWRHSSTRIEASRRRFIERWGYHPISPVEKALAGKMLFKMSVLLSYVSCPYTLKSRLSYGLKQELKQFLHFKTA